MPRPIFGAVDWWTFAELEDTTRFLPKRERDRDDFDTAQSRAADVLAQEWLGDDDAENGSGEDGYGFISWPGLEFCVSRGTKTVLMVRRRE